MSPSIKNVCVVIGDPVAHSLGPQMHNAAYAALHLEDQYHYNARRVTAGDLANFINEVRTVGIRGISCTIPHKISVIEHLDEIDAVASEIGAVNTVVNEDGRLIGYNTDWLGIIDPLEEITNLHDKKVALLGAGGAARAAAYGLTKKGSRLSIHNRTIDKGQQLAEEFAAAAYSLDDHQALEALMQADIIINTTSVGMLPAESQTPLTKEFINNRQIVFDAVYSPHETRLLREASEQGATVIHGSEMLLRQAMAQFKLYTGYEAPEAVMRSALHEALRVKRK